MDFNSNSQKQSVDSIGSPIHKKNKIKINFLKIWGGVYSVLIYLSGPALFIAFKTVKYLKTHGQFFNFQKIFAFLNKKQLVWVVVAALVFISFNENINLNPSEQNKNIFPILAVIKSNKIDNKILTIEENITNTEQKNADIRPSFKMAAVLGTASVVETPDNSATALGGGALINPNIDDYEADYSLMRVEIENYIVQSGDTISSIAEKFNITPKTITWENNMSLNTKLRVDQKLKILPISGVTHKVKSGDNVIKIAKLYRANPEDIMDFNELGNESDIFINDILIVPEGTPPAPPPAPKPIVKKYADKTEVLNTKDLSKPEGNNCHIFVPGQCTWYVAKKRCIPWTGHAKSWLANAKALRFSTGKTPALGAIINLKESWYGHVGYVEAFDDQTVTFSEMNHLGPWKTSRRTISLTDKRITGYIY